MFGSFSRAESGSCSNPQFDDRFRHEVQILRERADGKIFWLLIAQWAVVLCSILAMSPNWNVGNFDGLWASSVGVGILSSIPMWMVLTMPGRSATRYFVVVSQGLMSTLLWCVSGGNAESHLHVYGWLVVFSLYRDVPLLITGSLVTLLGHAVVMYGNFLPEQMERGVGTWHWHLAWLAGLLVEAAFASVFVALDRQSLTDRLRREIAVDSLNARLEHTVECRGQADVEDCDCQQTQTTISNSSSMEAESHRFEAIRGLMTLRRDVATAGTSIQNLVNRLHGEVPESCGSQWEMLRHEVQQLMQLIDATRLSVDTSSAAPTLKGRPDVGPRRLAPKIQSDTNGNEGTSEQRALLLVKNPYQQTRAVASLRAEGFAVDVVGNGPRAYYSVMLNDYAVIVVDVDLPGEEGFDTIEALRLLPPGRVRESKCLFALTTALEPDGVLRCTDLGVDGIFVKPLKPEALRQSLSKGPLAPSGVLMQKAMDAAVSRRV